MLWSWRVVGAPVVDMFTNSAILQFLADHFAGNCKTAVNTPEQTTRKRKSQFFETPTTPFHDVLALLKRFRINDGSMFALEDTPVPRDVTDVKPIVQNVTE